MAGIDTIYLLRMNAVSMRAFHQMLTASPDPVCQRLGRKLAFYFTDHPEGTCADCGVRPPVGQLFVSPESEAMEEVWYDGMRAVEAIPRHVCRPCHEAAGARMVALQKAGAEEMKAKNLAEARARLAELEGVA